MPDLPSATIIIPTFNRPVELTNCLASIITQTVKPLEVIVIDDGGECNIDQYDAFAAAQIPLICIPKDTPDLTTSRNIGIARARGEIICFLDDDTVVEPDYLKEILTVYQNDPKHEIGGVGGYVTNPKPLGVIMRLRRPVNVAFGISGFREGKVLPSGFVTNYNTTEFPLHALTQVDVLMGCTSSFRRDVFKQFLFRPNYYNYALDEDYDFSYRVAQHWKLFITPKARLQHFESPLSRPKKGKISHKFLIGRYLFFKSYVKTGWWSWGFFYYALTGYTLSRMLIAIAALVIGDRSECSRMVSIFEAWRDILRGRVEYQS
ncbi:glycosyltransferase family 2 protein [Desulfovibrio inopinatus]|uniref:glycosyltransferase family 2 protein n=1 Tax=Desulfovibrio inopinatus TaxID=102109 RepID=UPI0003FD8804|nr:glycosyltransferase family 2 protein [Desulfovibrio inopinatus]